MDKNEKLLEKVIEQDLNKVLSDEVSQDDKNDAHARAMKAYSIKLDNKKEKIQMVRSIVEPVVKYTAIIGLTVLTVRLEQNVNVLSTAGKGFLNSIFRIKID